MPSQKEDLGAVVVDLARETKQLAATIRRIEAKRHWSIYAHPWRFFLFSFLNGLFVVLGSTLGVAIVLYIFSWLGYLPVLGDLFTGLRQTIAP